MIDQAEIFQAASGRFAAQIYKEEIESALRTHNFGGFQLLELTDYPGQHKALVGMLDCFWDSKHLITPAEFRNFCNLDRSEAERSVVSHIWRKERARYGAPWIGGGVWILKSNVRNPDVGHPANSRSLHSAALRSR
jgi:hypothetical protein